MINLVTGGAGFIGSHLCERLLERGDEVFVIDNLSTGSFNNIRHLKDKKNFHLVITETTDRKVLEPIIAQCDVIYHLAAAVGVMKIIAEPIRTIETNVLGTHTILTLAAKYNKKILISSTSEVYGKANSIPFKENDDCVLGPTLKSRWSYACSKILDEFLAFAYYKEKGLPVVIVRLFNIVGPRQTGRYGMVIPRFVKQALEGKPMTVFGDGKQSRCFLHVSEAVEALIKVTENEEAVGQVVNIGSTEETTIEELARKVKQITNSSSEIIYVPYDEAYETGFEDMKRRIPDITKANKLIGFKPTKDIDFIIKSIIEWVKSGGRLTI